ncbi:MAG: hypothetical protein ACT4UQ_02785 [Gammaproteobacteria bacterium]
MNPASIRAAALLAGLLAAAPAFAWKLVAEGAPFVHKTGYSIQYPHGWRWIKMPFGDETLATRDGPELQAIAVDFRKHKNAFRSLGQDSSPGMMPQELAQKLVAEATSARGLQNMEILSDEPTLLAGRPGFRLHLAYRSSVDAGSVRYEEILVGANSPQGIFIVFYRAPHLHFFRRDVEAFEKSLATFSISDKAAKK